MNNLYKLFKYITRSTASTVTGLIMLTLLTSGITYYAHAASTQTKSYDVTNEPQMRLAVNLTTTQTTGIIIAAPKLNAANHTFATTTGGVLRIRFGAFQEDISFTGATVNPTTYQVTLVGVTRNLCPHVTRAYMSCGAGRPWGIGAIVELNNDARLLNLKANIDRDNRFSASGAIAFIGSGSFAPPWFSTTADRDQQLGASPSGPTKMACVSATGLCYLSTGGAWTTIGSTGVSNASETVAGKVQLGTLKDHSGSTVIGSTGAPTVVQTRYLTSSGGTSHYNARIPILGTGGMLSSSVIPAVNNLGIYGDGSDGDATISSVTTLTSDKYYDDLTITTAGRIVTRGYRIFVKGTLTMGGNAIITGTGGNAENGTNAAGVVAGDAGGSGASIPLGYFPATMTGSMGGKGAAGRTSLNTVGAAGQDGRAGRSQTNSILNSGTAGAAAGVGGSGGPGGGAAGAAGAAGTATPIIGGSPRDVLTASRFFVFSPSSNSLIHFKGSAASGGGGGGGSGGCSAAGSNPNSGAGGGGGGSGANGGYVFVAARIIVGTGSINASGGRGGNGGNGANATGASDCGGGGGGGGGSGGGGGVIIFIYQNIVAWTGHLYANGGEGGTGGTGGTPTFSGGNGASGSNGSSGPSGLVLSFQM